MNYESTDSGKYSSNNLHQSPMVQNRQNNYYDKGQNRLNNNNGVSSRLGVNKYRNNGQQSRFEYNNMRKRVGEMNSGPGQPKRRWNNNRKPYYQNSQAGPTHSIQDRLHRIRNSTNVMQVDPQPDYTEDLPKSPLNDSQEIDAPDITIQVPNNVAVTDEMMPAVFKMVLDPKTQVAIKKIQQKRREKQVIYPFPVTPSVTGISMHDRFSIL